MSSTGAACASRRRSTSGLQKIAEKWVRASTIIPHAKDPTAAAKAAGFKKLEPWMANLRDTNLRNGALVAYDYETGELVAYVGSASYYAVSSKPALQPQYDVIGQGYRQPGSAFKPFNYAVGINDKTITAGTMLMDVGTDFGGGYTPNDADRLERGPVRVRNALQFSLNIPAVKTVAINGTDHVFAKAKEFGMTFQGPRTADLALALGVQEVRPVDLVTAYGTLANGGKAIGHTTILTIKNTSGKDVVDPYVPPAGTQVVSPQAAFIVTDILAGNTNKIGQPVLGRVRGRRARRPPRRDAQDRHQQRGQGPQRLRLHRAADRRGPRGRRPRPGRRGLERQLGQQPGVEAGRSALLDRGVDLRLAGLPRRGRGQVAADRLPATDRRLGPGQDRPVHRAARHDRQGRGRRMVHHRNTEPKEPIRPGVCGIDVVDVVHVEIRVRRLDEGRSRLAAPGGQGPGRRRWAGTHADRVLLRQPVLPVRLQPGGCSWRDRAVNPARRRPATCCPPRIRAG